MSAVEERNELISGIFDNQYSKKEVVNKIQQLEEKYNDDAFTYFTVKGNEEYTAEYYKKLENLYMSGAASKEFILHAVEVRDALNKPNNKVRYVGMAVVTAIIVGVFWYVKR